MSIKHTLRLHRTYGTQGTNGTLYYNNQKICHTIELPDRNNLKRMSCIPAGTYRLKKRQFSKNGEQIAITNVLGREAILFHAANDAQRDLQGCIAPVTTIKGEGRGEESQKALIKLKALVYSLWDMGDEVFLQIR